MALYSVTPGKRICGVEQQHPAGPVRRTPACQYTRIRSRSRSSVLSELQLPIRNQLGFDCLRQPRLSSWVIHSRLTTKKLNNFYTTAYRGPDRNIKIVKFHFVYRFYHICPSFLAQNYKTPVGAARSLHRLGVGPPQPARTRQHSDAERVLAFFLELSLRFSSACCSISHLSKRVDGYPI
jgi:hypothetical protein